ncbi:MULTISPECIES: hypothetical protein [unclassified Streptomyces]|uniref:hypothetical protein n=1 Tax=unclassified Streptomyces TaxID=2593676 RepID=UPI0033F9931B
MRLPLPLPAQLGAVLLGLARNPALPPALLRRLLGHRATRDEAVMWRTDLTEELAEEIVALGDTVLVHTLACNRNIPPGVKHRLANSPDTSVRAAIAFREELPREVWERLIADPSVEVRESAAENEDVPVDLRARLARDPAPTVRAKLAQRWTGAPEEIRRIWLTDAESTVRAAACATYFRRLPHPVPPADLHPALLADPVTRAGVVAHLDLGPDTARELATDQDPEVRAAVAAHPDLPAELRETLAGDPDPLVRAEVFARQDTPEGRRASIYAELRAGAERAGAGLIASEEEDFASYVAYQGLGHRHLPWVSAAPLDHVDSPYVCFRRSLAMSGPLPAEAVARLLDDEDGTVRAAVARRTPDLDPVTAERIERRHTASRKHPWSPTDHVVFPPETLRRFATDPDPRIRALALRDPDLPAGLAEGLAADGSDRVRRGVAAHPSLPTPALLTLLADQDEWVARTAAGSPVLPRDVMEEILAFATL